MSLRTAINDKCRDCIYDPKAGGKWREQVAACSCTGCPLWPYRAAPREGALANPPRDPRNVPPGWVRASFKDIKSGTFPAVHVEHGVKAA